MVCVVFVDVPLLYLVLSFIYLQVFELVTGRFLFPPNSEPLVTPDELHLAAMLALTGETFSATMLERSQLRDKFFNADGAFVCLF